MWGIHRWPVNSPHKWPVTRNMLPFDDVIMHRIMSCPCRQPLLSYLDHRVTSSNQLCNISTHGQYIGICFNICGFSYQNGINELTYCDLVTQYDDRDLERLTATSHYLSQCWLLIIELLWHLPDSSFTASALVAILYNAFWYELLKLLLHLPGADELTHWGRVTHIRVIN